LGVELSRAGVDDYRDSAGHAYSGAVVSGSSGSASAKLFSQQQFGAATIIPFAQAGILRRFDHRNSVEIDGMAYSFSDADFSMFGRVGIDVDWDDFQSYLAVKGESSTDRQVLSGQLGVTVKLD
jgi:outer membrane autotransporter protein